VDLHFVLDPFCGCGTTIDAAEKLGRDWIGIDVTQLAISLIKNRLQDTYGSRMKFVSGSARSSADGSHLPLPPGEGESSAAHSASDAGVSLVRIIGEPTTPNGAAPPSHVNCCSARFRGAVGDRCSSVGGRARFFATRRSVWRTPRAHRRRLRWPRCYGAAPVPPTG